MLEILKEAILDSIKLLPFLFIVYLVMEYIEHKSNKKTERIIKSSGKFGPIVGGILGAFPQCGFSVMASNLYVARVISLGTLFSIYLSTSDEMLPILLSSGAEFNVIAKFLFAKILIGITIGVIIDLLIRRKNVKVKTEMEKICNHESCHCDENIFLSSLKHTFNILVFIFIINIIMDSLIFIVGEENISSLFVSNIFIGPIISSLIGLIPNCASSVIITELFINNTITFGSAIAGLLSSSGIGLLVLFKVNKNYKENIKILSALYLISAFIGIILNLFF